MTDAAVGAPSGGAELNSADNGKKKKKDKSNKRGFFGKIFLFLRQVIAELKKVVRPTRQELFNYVGVVLAFVLVMMLIVTLLDIAWGKLMIFVFSG